MIYTHFTHQTGIQMLCLFLFAFFSEGYWDFLVTTIQLTVNCWFGARWFGYLGSPYERDCYLGVPRFRIPNQFHEIKGHATKTGIAWDRLPLVEPVSSSAVHSPNIERLYRHRSSFRMLAALMWSNACEGGSWVVHVTWPRKMWWNMTWWQD